MNEWEVYGRQMEGREYEDLRSINMEITQIEDKLNEEMGKMV